MNLYNGDQRNQMNKAMKIAAMQTKAVWAARAENYSHLFDLKRKAKLLPSKVFLDAIALLPAPKVNYYGWVNPDYFGDEFQKAGETLDREFLLIWLWSDEAWLDYVRQFNDLPDPVDKLTDPVDNSPKPVEKIVDKPAKPVEQPVENALTNRRVIHSAGAVFE